ncbi:MAG: hypothetical protein PHU01_14470, partial [Desulfuromonadaceae bacterium]|nr:hypothetical protein [Desulfuromonadaceae bacterium]
MKINIYKYLVCSIIFGLSAQAYALDLAGVDIHGFASQGFVKTINQESFIADNSGEGSLNFNEFGINFSKQVTSDLHLGMQLFAQDRGNYGKDKLSLDWAYGDYRFEDWLGFRAGKIKNPIGLYNETRDTDSLRTSILLPQGVYADAQRDNAIALTGAGIYGAVPAGAAGALEYQIQVGVLPIETDGGSAEQMKYKINATGVGNADVTDAGSSTTLLHHLEWQPPVDGLRLAAMAIHTKINFQVEDSVPVGMVTLNPVPPAVAGAKAVIYAPRITKIKNDNLNKYVLSAEYTWRDLILSAEYLRQNFDANSTSTVYKSVQGISNSKTVQTKR